MVKKLLKPFIDRLVYASAGYEELKKVQKLFFSGIRKCIHVNLVHVDA
mgnify:CR=1 FL=1